MGNDGGVIAVKRKFMRHANQKAKHEKLDQDTLRAERAQTCAISGELLKEPIVACELGNLYNKEALLEHLLASTMPEKFQHVTSLRDVVNCKFSWPNNEKKSSSFADQAPICPVTMLEFNGKQPFVVAWSCGCVVSDRATKQVQSTECLACGASIEKGKLIALLLPEEEYDTMQRALLARKAEEKRLKKESKKSKKRSKDETNDQDASSRRDKEKELKRKKAKPSKPETSTAPSSVSTIAHEAAIAIEEAKQKNKVFASLFSKDKKEEKKSAGDLLMAVGGLRYTLS
ncbi:hypothetical protein ATCC90586_000563 [Pythium insidiosum]|nr:hypothetical protein ATCC90586_000563 [Pythium insidiosum]